MAGSNDYIRFDWAIKRILRDKANKGVLEGLMTVLLGNRITILEILESESNRDSKEDKSNRVDVKAKTEQGEIILVEVQLARERHFMQRILFGTSKAVIEQMRIAQDYDQIKKVYSINVLYFDLGSGDDYCYHGRTIFTGFNNKDSVLQFNRRESEIVSEHASVVSPNESFPEYFLLRVNQFNEVARTPIEEWMAYLKDGIIKSDTDTPGLREAKEKLDYMRMTREERRAYEEYMVSVHAAQDVWDTAKEDGYREGMAAGKAAGLAEGLAEGKAAGLAEGKAAGLAEGLAEGKAAGLAEGKAAGLAEGLAEGEKNKAIEVAHKLKAMGLSTDDIVKATGLTAKEIEAL